MAVKIEDKTWEAGRKRIESIINRMYRRLSNVIIGVMPQIPIFGFVSEIKDGLIGRYIIPGSCKLISFDAMVGKFEEEDQTKLPSFNFLIKRTNQTISNEFYTDGPDTKVSLDAELKTGDIIEIRSNDKISEVSYTLVFDFGKELQTSHKFIAEELDKLLEISDESDSAV